MASLLSSLTRRSVLGPASLSLSSPSPGLSRLFNTSSPVLARRSRLEEDVSLDELTSYLDETGETNDSPSAGHLLLQEQRMMMHYVRLIQHQVPKLAALRKPFVPPTSEEPLIVRSTDYLGEEHPTQNKKSVVVAVDHLPLRDEMAKKRLILLAGPRWTPNPPTDSGVSKYADWGHGFVKIACEDYPQPAMNLKWISDTLDKLVERANTADKNWEGLPIDLRHVYAKSRKAKKGEHLRGRVLAKPTIRDFPQEWLPKNLPDPQPVSPS